MIAKMIVQSIRLGGVQGDIRSDDEVEEGEEDDKLNDGRKLEETTEKVETPLADSEEEEYKMDYDLKEKLE